jgi:shikimate kinase
MRVNILVRQLELAGVVEPGAHPEEPPA